MYTMTKKIFSLTCILAMTASLFAQEIEFTYELDATEGGANLEITGVSAGTTLSGVVQIPSTIDNDGTTFTITSIGESAFNGSSNVAEFVLPSTLKRIKAFAFAKCNKLEKITIPSSVSSIGYNPFNNCERLSYIDVEEENTIFTSVDGVLISTNVENSKLICYPSGKKNNIYTVPEGVISVGPYAFMGAWSLSEVTVPDGTKNIGVYSFTGCTNLLRLNLGASVEFFQAPVFLLSEESSSYCNVREVHFSSRETAPHIEGVFDDMPNVKLYIPLGSRALYENSTYEVSSSVGPKPTGWNQDVIRTKTIEEGYADADFNTTPLLYNSIWDYETNGPVEGEVQVASNQRNPYYGDIYIPSTITVNEQAYTVTRINQEAFYYNDNLQSVSIPATVKKFVNWTFRNTPDLREIYVSEDNEQFMSVDGILYDKSMSTLVALPSAMYFSDGIYETPESVTKIELGAINDTQFLRIFNTGANKIESANFYNCNGLDEVHFTNVNMQTFRVTQPTSTTKYFFLTTTIPETYDYANFSSCTFIITEALYEQVKAIEPWLYAYLTVMIQNAEFNDNLLNLSRPAYYAENLDVTLNFSHNGPRSACFPFPIPISDLQSNGITAYGLYEAGYLETIDGVYNLKFLPFPGWDKTPIDKPLILVSDYQTGEITFSLQNVLLPKEDDTPHSLEWNDFAGVSFTSTMIESDDPDHPTMPTDIEKLAEWGSSWALGGGKLGRISATTTVLPHRWIVSLPAIEGSTGASQLRFSLGDASSTDLDIITEKSSAPALPIYNLNGIRAVSGHLTPGLYVQGGKIFRCEGAKM